MEADGMIMRLSDDSKRLQLQSKGECFTLRAKSCSVSIANSYDAEKI